MFNEPNAAANATFVNNTLSAEAEAAIQATTPVAYIGTQGYVSLQAAIDAAKDGDTVVICAGEYGAINISNKNITIQGTVGDNGELLHNFVQFYHCCTIQILHHLDLIP